ncbi:MAG: hypothetical protein F6K10_17295 [Moorea sp. SIO2B7]|nr:hypothetical protein [Moorena sp. SIO2B7]
MLRRLKPFPVVCCLLPSLTVNFNFVLRLSGSDDKTLKIWNLEGGDLLPTLKAHGSWVSSVAISPDGRTMVNG